MREPKERAYKRCKKVKIYQYLHFVLKVNNWKALITNLILAYNEDSIAFKFTWFSKIWNFHANMAAQQSPSHVTCSLIQFQSTASANRAKQKQWSK